MRAFSLYRYTIPLQSGLVLRNQQQHFRQGIICHLQDGKKSGWGEIAPLIGFSQETLSQAEQQTLSWLQNWQKGENPPFHQLFPSVAFGLSVAVAELQQTNLVAPQFQSVPLCSDSSEQTLNHIRQQNNQLAKLKVGRLSIQQDSENVRTLLAEIPTLSLRLDANRAWDLNNATLFAQSLTLDEKQRITFIEEPCHTPEQSLQFAKNQQIPIAWDESVQNPDFQLEPQEWLKAIIIKPTLIGSLEKCLSLIQQAKQYQLQAVISSSIESSLALSQLAQIATQHTPNTPAGLDTLSLMQHQLIRPFPQSDLPLLGIDSQYIQQIH